MANASGIVWQTSPGALARNVESYKRKLLAAVFALAGEWARRLEAQMRANASWTDRTGEARRGLFGRVFRMAVGAAIVLGGTAAHQVFLERRWSGKYSIINPTLQQAFAPIMASLQRLVR